MVKPEPEDASTPPLLTVEEVARLLRVAPKTVYRYVAQGYLPAVRFGGTMRFLRNDLEALLQRQRGVEEGLSLGTRSQRGKCASCQRWLPLGMLTAACVAPECAAPLCTDCQALWPDLLCPRHRPSLEQRLALARQQGLRPVTAQEATLWERDFLSRFIQGVEAQSVFPHPLGGARYTLHDARRTEDTWWRDEVPFLPEGQPLPRLVSVVYRFPAEKGGRPKWALAAAVLARLGPFAQQGFATEAVSLEVWQEWFQRLAQQAGAEGRVWVVGVGSPTGWASAVRDLIAGSPDRRPFYDRWVAVALVSDEDGERRLWANPADGRLKPYLGLFLGRLPAEVETQVREYIRRRWQEGRIGITIREVQQGCQVDETAVRVVFHILEREGMGDVQWVDGFGPVLFQRHT